MEIGSDGDPHPWRIAGFKRSRNAFWGNDATGWIERQDRMRDLVRRTIELDTGCSAQLVSTGIFAAVAAGNFSAFAAVGFAAFAAGRRADQRTGPIARGACGQNHAAAAAGFGDGGEHRRCRARGDAANPTAAAHARKQRGEAGRALEHRPGRSARHPGACTRRRRRLDVHPAGGSRAARRGQGAVERIENLPDLDIRDQHRERGTARRRGRLPAAAL